MLINIHGDIINTAHLLSATPIGLDDRRTQLRFNDGSTKTVEVGTGRFERACGVIVPAAPGFSVVTAILSSEAGESVVYIEEPVIAFRVNGLDDSSEPVPITVSGEPTTLGDSRWTIKQPNGACFGPDAQHDSMEDFQADCERARLQLAA